jgi:hypothetical protein
VEEREIIEVCEAEYGLVAEGDFVILFCRRKAVFSWMKHEGKT